MNNIVQRGWVEQETLKDDGSNPVEELLGGDGRAIKMVKEGIHFDLEH